MLLADTEKMMDNNIWTKSKELEPHHSCTCCLAIRQSDRFRLLKTLMTSRFAIYLCSNGIVFASVIGDSQLLTALVLSKGYSLNEAIYVLSVGAFVDGLFRIFVGFLFDAEFMKNYRLTFYNCAYVVNGLSMFGIAFAHRYVNWYNYYDITHTRRHRHTYTHTHTHVHRSWLLLHIKIITRRAKPKYRIT